MIQVLINLIENSMKFGKNASQRKIDIRTRRKGGNVEIMVSDSGPGIPRNALKKVFDEFYRVENSLTRSTRGTGIGLALVKKFVQLMNGSVTAANNDGPGCTITITLPG
jgi:signal transduction histidine kinase